MNDDKKSEVQPFVPSGVVGEAVVVPPNELKDEKTERKTLPHRVVLYHSGGQIEFGKQFVHSGLIKDKGVTYVGFFWDEPALTMTIAFNDKFRAEYDASATHIRQLVSSSKSPLKTGIRPIMKKIDCFPKKNYKYKFLEYLGTPDPNFVDPYGSDIKIDLKGKLVTLNFRGKNQVPTNKAIEKELINKWLVDYEVDPERFVGSMVKGVKSEDSRWWDLHEEFWEKAEALRIGDHKYFGTTGE